MCGLANSPFSSHRLESTWGFDSWPRYGRWRIDGSRIASPLGGRLVEERCAFLVCGRDAPPSGVSAGGARGSNGDGQHEEDSHDDEGEDPLECNDLALELGDTNCGGQDAESEAHGVVLD